MLKKYYIADAKDPGIEHRIKDLGIFCHRSCADNIRLRLQLVYQNAFRLKGVSNIKRLLGPKPTASTMKEERPAMHA